MRQCHLHIPRRFKVPDGWTVIQWITDFSERIKQLQKVTAATGSKGLKVLSLFKQQPKRDV